MQTHKVPEDAEPTARMGWGVGRLPSNLMPQVPPKPASRLDDPGPQDLPLSSQAGNDCHGVRKEGTRGPACSSEALKPTLARVVRHEADAPLPHSFP